MDFLDYFYYFGYFFVLLACGIALWANFHVKRTFRNYSSQLTRSGLTGAEAARAVLHQNDVSGVSIERVSGELSDHFDPRNNTVYLSENVYNSSSTAAIGVAAHEAGHAVQHATNYFPIRVRTAIVPVTNIGSRLSMPLILIGIVFSFYPLAMIGVYCYGLCTLFQLVTLPTEYNASARAMTALSAIGTLQEEELSGAQKTLNAAALTYVAALVVALTQFLRLLAMVSGGGRRRR